MPEVSLHELEACIETHDDVGRRHGQGLVPTYGVMVFEETREGVLGGYEGVEGGEGGEKHFCCFE